MPQTLSPHNALTILVSCAGRRVELVQAFRSAAHRLGIGLRIVAADQSPTAAALLCADIPVLVPPIQAREYIPALLDAVRAHSAALLIPTIDTDLLTLAENRAAFEALGCAPLIAPPEVIRTCRDKVLTYRFLVAHGFDTPLTFTPDEFRAQAARTFPYFIKPRQGSASLRVHKIEDQTDLDYFLQKIHDPIVQEFVAGQEYTLDVYVGLTGQVRCVVPRLRWQVRSGEVAKGVVVKDREIMNAGRAVVETFGGAFRGLVTLQCIVTPQRRIRFIEINPRFGGGAPIGIAAGADYPSWLLEERLGRTPAIAFDGFRHGLCATRFDWAAFIPLQDDLTPRVAPPLREFPLFE